MTRSETRFLAARSKGFTLAELAIVLIIVSLLIGGMFVSLSASRDIASDKDTQKQLAAINEALLGFAAANGRLPCPATAVSNNGREEFCTTDSGSCVPGQFIPPPLPTTGRCVDFFNGFVPAATLGLSPTNDHGFVIDAWGNPVRYAVSDNPPEAGGYPFTTPPSTTTGMKGVWATDPTQIRPDLNVCSISAGIINGTCATGQSLTDNAAAVIFSTGKNGGAAPAPGNADERANWTSSSDHAFVSHTSSPDFDDIVIWLSPNILYNRMISAGRLP